ncbi:MULTISPECIES: TnsA endonuclease N-terminal domain-containing protein, partial [Enterobacter cloacae complex]|uniref:TnsA endonuclease N-terminal domain-containing protein n=1 Tax=Enterobacter cloacae complex TaxID=354276 RepID=UPI001FFADF8A
LRTSCPNRIPVISKLVLVLDIYSSLSLIWRYSYCLVFQGATSIREQFPLFPLRLTQQIANHLHFQHPMVRGVRGVPVEVLNVMTTDFLLTLRTPEGGLRYKAIAVKHNESIPEREAQKLEIERMFWQLIDVEFQIYVGSELNNVVGKNICWATSVLRDGSEFYDKYPLDKILWKLKPDVYPIVGLRAMISSIFGVDAQEAMMLLQAMIGLKMINVDLSYPILETGLIKIISNDHYIGLNANGYY